MINITLLLFQLSFHLKKKDTYKVLFFSLGFQQWVKELEDNVVC